ncbi:hypothetical protein FPZ42_11250 [Mucilaginibacter achroorhodeus]|uniref:Uncharacterized protein n=1 Tax=Mucilaginibacter achroorhodeus TaxID=2599294 RepID=A0A563U4B5_9SPHI|nr:hypothetical protein [Mucilaginibacter achroorhodeus]TWR26196.1 hypothetical protein FPZ42_11250 [Mucilaginibacter achroorhodeus]
MITYKKTLLTAAIASLALGSCQNQHADLNANTNYADPDSITYELAKKYVKNYEKRAGYIDSVYSESNLSKVKKLPDTRAIWFSADRLQKLANKVKSEGGDGIRFYLAAYDSVYSEGFTGGHKPDRIYWNRNTLVMVSTKDSTNKVGQKFHRDYYTDKPTANTPPRGFIVGNPPENRGEICPPPRDCNTIGATLIK